MKNENCSYDFSNSGYESIVVNKSLNDLKSGSIHKFILYISYLLLLIQ